MPETPTIFPGAVVHYILPRSPRKHRPAIVTRVRNNGTVDLHVATTSVRRFPPPCFNVRGVFRDVTGTVGGTWHSPEAGDPAHLIADYVAPDVAATAPAAAVSPPANDAPVPTGG